MIFFLFLCENIHCGYSLKVPQWGTSNEYLQLMFSWRNKKNISTFGMKKVPSKAVFISGYFYQISSPLFTASLK